MGRWDFLFKNKIAVMNKLCLLFVFFIAVDFSSAVSYHTYNICERHSVTHQFVIDCSKFYYPRHQFYCSLIQKYVCGASPVQVLGDKKDSQRNWIQEN